MIRPAIPPRQDPASGAVVFTGAQDRLVHLGHGDLALTKTSVVHLPAGTSAPIMGLPGRPIYAVRAKAPDRFLLVLEADSPAPDGSSQELWEIDAGGIASLLGAFPPPPAYAKWVYPFMSRLDACGGLVQFGEGPEVFEDILVRRELGGASEVVYTEADDPLVKVHISALVSGP